MQKSSVLRYPAKPCMLSDEKTLARSERRTDNRFAKEAQLSRKRVRRPERDACPSARRSAGRPSSEGADDRRRRSGRPCNKNQRRRITRRTSSASKSSSFEKGETALSAKAYPAAIFNPLLSIQPTISLTVQRWILGVLYHS